MSDHPLKVSILIPTFDRPELLFRTLQHIHQQTFSDYEVILVDDGSADATKAKYTELLASSGLDQDARLRWLYMPPRETRLSNPSIPRNAALKASQGELIIFCDDDDYWCDDAHLAISVAEFDQHPELDFFFADQQGYLAGELKIARWQPDLLSDLCDENCTPGVIYDVPVATFCKHWTPHTNTSVFRKSLLDRMGGFWAYTPMEGDVDFVYRAAAHARLMRFRDTVVCIHEIPDRSKSLNASTRVSQAERYMFRMAIANHLILHTDSADVRRFAREIDSYAAQKLAAEIGEKAPAAALHFAWRGFCFRPSPHALRNCVRYAWRIVKN